MLEDYLPILLRTTRQTEPHYRDPLLDDRSPTELHPVFHGCFDWHSAVHSHWSMVRLLRSGIGVDALAERLGERLTPELLLGEAATAGAAPGFEVPYGHGWVLMLDAELALLGNAVWRDALAPLTAISRDRMVKWLGQPVNETGLHHQTAFSLNNLIEWATVTGAEEEEDFAQASGRAEWGSAIGRSLLDEAGPTDFLSPNLMAAVVMARCVTGFPDWLSGFLPELVSELDVVAPAVHDDPTDGRKTHLDGLNLNRAWAALQVAKALPSTDPRQVPLASFADRHARVGLPASITPHFAGAHWLPTFAILFRTTQLRASTGDPIGSPDG